MDPFIFMLTILGAAMCLALGFCFGRAAGWDEAIDSLEWDDDDAVLDQEEL